MFIHLKYFLFYFQLTLFAFFVLLLWCLAVQLVWVLFVYVFSELCNELKLSNGTYQPCNIFKGAHVSRLAHIQLEHIDFISVK